jgi:hypothetical protein
MKIRITQKILIISVVAITCTMLISPNVTNAAVEGDYRLFLNTRDADKAAGVRTAANKMNDIEGISVEIIEFSSATTETRLQYFETELDAGDIIAIGNEEVKTTIENITDSAGPPPSPGGRQPIIPDSPASRSPSDKPGETLMGFMAGYKAALGIDTSLNQDLTPRQVIQNTINVVLTLIGILAAGILVVGGIMYITSAGEEEKAAKAKKLILYAIVGLLIIGVSAIVVNVIINTVFK